MSDRIPDPPQQTDDERALERELAESLVPVAFPTTPEAVARAEAEQSAAATSDCPTTADLISALRERSAFPSRDEPATRDGEARAQDPRRRYPRLIRRRALPIAAALLAAVGGIAVGASLWRHSGRFLGTSLRSSVAGWQARGYDFQPTDLPGSATVRHDVPFALADGQVGTLFGVQARAAGGYDVVAFDGQGRLLWQASRTWNDWATTLGAEAVSLDGIRRVYSDRKGDGLTESVLLVSHRDGRSALRLIDPRTGRRRWAEDVYYDGFLWNANSRGSAIQPMPEDADGRRALVVAGSRGKDLRSEPVVLVIDPRGDVRQQIRLPVLEQGRIRGVHAAEVRVNWRADPPTVLVESSDAMFFEFDWRDERLDVASVRIRHVDAKFTWFRERYGQQAYERLLQQLGGEGHWREGLAATVRERHDKLPTGWR